MPSVSDAQRRAMFAAASGHSTLGIPKKVGEEFVEADKRQDSPAEEASESNTIDSRPAHRMEVMTGMKKTHRGKRSRGKGPKSPADHKSDLDTHMAAGNHASAKISALMLAKALHKRQTGTPGTAGSLTPSPKTAI